MKLTFVITGLSVGGAETMLLKLLERLSADFTPHVVSLRTIGEMGSRIKALGVPVDAIHMNPRAPNPLALMKLRSRLRQVAPDIVHTWLYHADLVGGIAARWAGVPAVAWCVRHTNLDPRLMRWSTRAVVHACARLSRRIPDCIVSNSHAAKDAHTAIGYDASRFTVIPNGFDLDIFRPDPLARREVRAQLGIPPDAPLIGLIARFHPEKNHRGFLEAAAQFHQQLPNAHFLLVGEGIDERNPQLRGLVQSAGIHAVTRLLGPRRDIPRITASLDVAVCNSFGEAFPNVVGEAMACEVPVVATDVGDAALIIGDTGRIVRVGDRQALADAWKTLLSMSAEQRRALGMSARARIADRFEIRAVVRRYEDLYRLMLGRLNKKCAG